MDGLEPIHEAQERDRKDPFLQRSVPLESNPGHLRTNDSPAKELTAGRSVRKRARARSRSAQNPENPPFEARALKQPLGSTVALQRSAAGFALEIAASLISRPKQKVGELAPGQRPKWAWLMYRRQRALDALLHQHQEIRAGGNPGCNSRSRPAERHRAPQPARPLPSPGCQSLL